MKKIYLILIILSVLFACDKIENKPAEQTQGSDLPGNNPPTSNNYMIIDHTTTSLNGIPEEYIQTAISNLKVHFLGQSHSGQILGGLDSIETANATFSVDDGYFKLPTTSGALSLYTAQQSGMDFAYYMSSANGSFSNALAAYSSINVSIFIWCRDLEEEEEGFVQDYLNNMTALELANPGVRFVYATGNADATGAEGAKRFHHNELIRNFVKQGNNRILFDFEDLDCWRYENNQWVQYTYTYNNETIPSKHPELLEEPGFNWAHATEESCIQKGRAFWYLMARLAGWDGL